MRNDKISKTSDILALVGNLPYFSFISLKNTLKNDKFLKITLSRLAKRGKIIRLKKGYYVANEYATKIRLSGATDDYLEFLANVLYPSSYLSLEYVLARHGILSESIFNFTSISANKTKLFANEFGTFIYHKIKPELFCGFEIFKAGDFFILRATKAKALFDFLYLRKNLLSRKKSVDELRLNLGLFSDRDKREFKKYIGLEKSIKMKTIVKLLNF